MKINTSSITSLFIGLLGYLAIFFYFHCNDFTSVLGLLFLIVFVISLICIIVPENRPVLRVVLILILGLIAFLTAGTYLLLAHKWGCSI